MVPTLGSRAYLSIDLSIYLSMYLLPKFIGSVVAVVVLRVYPEKQFMNVFGVYEHESQSGIPERRLVRFCGTLQGSACRNTILECTVPIHEDFLIHLRSGEPSIYPLLQGVQDLSATTMLPLAFGHGGLIWRWLVFLVVGGLFDFTRRL